MGCTKKNVHSSILYCQSLEVHAQSFRGTRGLVLEGPLGLMLVRANSEGSGLKDSICLIYPNDDVTSFDKVQSMEDM